MLKGDVKTLAAIILSYGSFRDTTKLCLDSIIAQLPLEDCSVLVIDNCSPDTSSQEIANYLKSHPEISQIHLRDNLGFAGGMNLGVSVTESKWVLLLNSDTFLPSGTIEHLILLLWEQPNDVGLIGPITNAAGTEQSYQINDSMESIMNFASTLLSGRTELLVKANRLDFFCVAIRRSLWNELGGLDEGYGLGYYEDVDFCLRAREVGARMLFSEDIFVYHAGSASFESSGDTKTLIRRNKALFLRRHSGGYLEHRRESNMRVILEYLRLFSLGVWNRGLETRISLRAQLLDRDYPRSPIKRLRWLMRVRAVKRRLVDLGIDTK